jgi:hypothetical protein
MLRKGKRPKPLILVLLMASLLKDLLRIGIALWIRPKGLLRPGLLIGLKSRSGRRINSKLPKNKNLLKLYLAGIESWISSLARRQQAR